MIVNQVRMRRLVEKAVRAAYDLETNRDHEEGFRVTLEHLKDALHDVIDILDMAPVGGTAMFEKDIADYLDEVRLELLRRLDARPRGSRRTRRKPVKERRHGTARG